MNETIDIALLKHQSEFVFSEAINTGLVAGFGAGKSHTGTYKTIKKKLQYPGVNSAYYLPTYSLIKGIAFPNFSEALKEIGIPFRINSSDKEIITPYGKIILRSMDNPGNIVGYEVGYSLIDEMDILPKVKANEALVKIVGRNRSVLPDGQPNCTDVVSSPEGFNFMYDFFVKKQTGRKNLIKAKTTDNHHLPKSYIDTLRDLYNEEQLQAYINGEFVNLTSGTVYTGYDVDLNHSDRIINKNDVLRIGMDFNITKMNAVVHIIEGNKMIAVDEIVNAYDTNEMADIILDRYPGHKIFIYPDASGNNRNTAGETDIDILRKKRFTVIMDKKNPPVKDRVNIVNSGFHNANGERSYLVNAKTCPNYSEALMALAYKNGVPDKNSGHDHITEAGGYCYYKMTNKTTVRYKL